MKRLKGLEQMVEYETGETIFTEGESTREMYVVQAGLVSIRRKMPDGNIVELTKVKKGGILGEMSLLESLPRSAAAIAEGRTRLLVIQPGSLLVKIRRDPTFAFEIMQILSGRIRNVNSLLDKLSDKEAKEEIAGALDT